jgi:hypothetical protein
MRVSQSGKLITLSGNNPNLIQDSLPFTGKNLLLAVSQQEVLCGVARQEPASRNRQRMTSGR